MKYRPYWQRIIILAVIFNIILFLVSASMWSSPKIEESPPENLQEIEWIEPETPEILNSENAPEFAPNETFSEIILPPFEIPHTEFEPLPKIEITPPPIEKKETETPQTIEEKEIESPPPTEETETETPQTIEKKENNPADKLKVIVKVLPKDLIEQFIKSGVIKEKLNLDGEKIVLSVTITVEGKVRNVEILQGGGNDERGKMINLLVKTAAQSWIFEPYLDEDGNPQELKTQIEFTNEDF